ncbi:hypothetical protein KSS87_015891 [Heliosperma pusillum]|nr:hypothetical protein KSS87_015891 [Heliosperma pusillum]
MDDNNLNPNDLPIETVRISGPTLCSLLHHLTSSSTSPTTGLLYGHLSLHTPTTLSDDTPTPTPSPSSLIATITGSTLSHTPSTSPARRIIIGHFSARPRTPLRPSLLDHTHSNNSSFIFLLLTTPSPPSPHTLIHTHDYRAYHFRPESISFQPVSLEIVNIGPGFRGQYHHFSPTSGLPWMPCVSHVGSPMREDGNGSKSLREMKRVGNDQKDLDGYVSAGYDVGSLTRLVGSDAVGYMVGVEELYDTMLAKLKGLASLVEASSARLLQQLFVNIYALFCFFGYDSRLCLLQFCDADVRCCGASHDLSVFHGLYPAPKSSLRVSRLANREFTLFICSDLNGMVGRQFPVFG